MPTITVRNVPTRVVRSLKALANATTGRWSRKCGTEGFVDEARSCFETVSSPVYFTADALTVTVTRSPSLTRSVMADRLS